MAAFNLLKMMKNFGVKHFAKYFTPHIDDILRANLSKITTMTQKISGGLKDPAVRKAIGLPDDFLSLSKEIQNQWLSKPLIQKNLANAPKEKLITLFNVNSKDVQNLFQKFNVSLTEPEMRKVTEKLISGDKNYVVNMIRSYTGNKIPPELASQFMKDGLKFSMQSKIEASILSVAGGSVMLTKLQRHENLTDSERAQLQRMANELGIDDVEEALNIFRNGYQKTVEPNIFYRMTDWLLGTIMSIANGIERMLKKTDASGKVIRGTEGGFDYVKITGLALFASLVAYMIYKIIKWFKTDDDTVNFEENEKILNNNFRLFFTKLDEGYNDIEKMISSNILSENTEQQPNKIISRALPLAPELAKFSIEAKQNEDRTDISIIRKVGYFFLGNIAGFISVLLFVNGSRLYMKQ